MAPWTCLLLCGASLVSGAVLGSREASGKAYDYVIVGGGTAGLTVGDRLSESGKHSVLVVEYGKLSGGALYDITSAPSPGLGNRRFPVDVGFVVGGSSAVNGMIFQRGNAKDYDIWGELAGGNNTWSWGNLLGYFRKGIQLTPPKPEVPADFNLKYDMKYWGDNYTSHNIFATFPNNLAPGMFPMYQALKALPGVNVAEDSGSGETGIAYWMTSTDPRTGARSFARTGHWDNLNRDNYHLLPETKVNEIIFKDNAAVGVRITPSGANTSTIIHARKEVILAAGAIHTPQILQLSGIGPADFLQRAKIPVKVDLPGVGSNFQDHSFTDVSFRWTQTPAIPSHLLNTPRPDNLGRSSLGISLSLPAISPNFSSIAARFAAQDPAAYLPPNTHPTIIAGYRAQQAIYAREMLRDDFSFLRVSASGNPTFTPINIHPVSRGTVLINPDAPEDEPIVDYRGASNPTDVELSVEGIKFLRKLMTTGELEKYGAVEISPGKGLESGEQLAEWVRARSVPSVYHPVGTAPMMPRELGGVVGGELRVYGVERLSVVDASVMTTIVAATTSMSVYAIAEKAADLIKARA